MKILITGASGFIGSSIVEEALRRGFDTWAAVRPSSSRAYLTDPRIHFVELNLDDKEQLRQRMAELRPDYVVHAAGATKCRSHDDFYRINTDGTRHLAEAMAEAGCLPRRMVFTSSLSVLGPVRESSPHAPMTADDEPRPDTHYGRSKLMAEQALAQVPGLDYVILRPTGVYGPRERDYFMMVSSIKQHVDFAAGWKPQTLTFVYVTDLVQAIFLALDHGRTGAAYLISDGREYTSRTFSDLAWRELGKPWLIRLKAPLWLLRIITLGGDLLGRITGRMTALNSDKYRIMRQRNWRCDITPARKELGYEPQVPLSQGVRKSVEWYRDNGWI